MQSRHRLGWGIVSTARINDYVIPGIRRYVTSPAVGYGIRTAA